MIPANAMARARTEIRLLALIKEGPLTGPEIAEALGITLRAVTAIAQDLNRAGVTERLGYGKYSKISLVPEEVIGGLPA